MLARLIAYFRPPPIVDCAALQQFLSESASYLAQRSTYEFSRNTLSYYGQGAWHDPTFQDLMRVCRWESRAAVLADQLVLVEGRLRPFAGEPPVLVAPVVGLYGDLLAEYPVPAHRPEGWGAEIDAMRARLERVQLAQPLGAPEVARTAAKRVFDVLPVYSRYRDADFQVVENSIRFGMVSFSDQLGQRLRPQEVAADLLRR